MATRFYLPSTGSAPESVTKSAYWDGQADNYAACKAVVAKSSTSMATRSLDGNGDGNDTDYAYGQWVSDPIAAQTISAQTVKVQIRASEENSRANQYVAISIRVVSNDGATVRGTIYQGRDGTELATSLVNRSHSFTSTQVVASANDRIVIEIGTGGDPSVGAGGNSHDCDMRVGDTAASDLPENDTSTDDYNPWVEFANTLTFPSSGISGEADITLGDLTASAAGTIAVEGTASITLGDLTLSATGTVDITGDADITLDDTTLSAAGSINTERPEVTLTSPDDTDTISDPTPTLEFIGTDADGDDLEYQVQVIGSAVCDSYDVSNYTTPFAFGTTIKAGQSFSGNNKSLKSVEFYLYRYGLPNGTIRAVLYAHSGTFGSSSVPTGDPIAVSDVKQMGDINTALQLVEFDFTTNPVLSDDYYVVALEVVDKTLLNSSNTIRYGTRASGATHSGNYSYYISSWAAIGTVDVIFYVNTLDALIDAVSDTDPGFENLDDGGDTHPFTQNESIGYTVQSEDELEADTYSWRVRAYDGFGWGDWSDTRSFAIVLLVSGTVDITLDDITLSSAGAVTVHGSADITLDDLTLSSAATAVVGGELAKTLDDLSLSSAGVVEIDGSAALQLDDATLSAEGSVSSGAPISGSADITLDDLSLSSDGSISISGASAITLDDLSLGSAGAVVVSGQSDITLDDLTAASSGVIAVSGEADITLDDLTVESAGAVDVVGNANITLDDTTLSSEGVVGSLPISGEADITLEDLTAASAGVVLVSGDAYITLGDLVSSAVGAVSVSGSAEISFDDSTLVSGGAVTIDGDASITLDDLTCAATATTETNLVLGSLDVTLDDLVLASAGEVDIAGAVGVTLEDMTLDSSAAVALFGQAVIVLDDMSLTSVGTVYFAAAIELTLAPRGFSFDLLERDFTWTLVEDDYSWNLEERSTSLTLEDRV